MFPIRFKPLALLFTAIFLTGCGLAQKVVEGTKSTASAVFYKQIHVLHLDFVSRSALNTDAGDTPLSTMVHVWQLKNRDRFDKADYDSLFMHEEKVLEADVLAEHSVWIKPEGAVSLDVPLDKDAQYIAVVGQFYQPDEKSGSWRLVLKREELEADKPRTIELMRSDLRLLSLKDK